MRPIFVDQPCHGGSSRSGKGTAFLAYVMLEAPKGLRVIKTVRSTPRKSQVLQSSGQETLL